MTRPAIEITRCDEHDHIAITVNGELIHQDDYGALQSLVAHLSHIGAIELKEEMIDRDEYERRYA